MSESIEMNESCSSDNPFGNNSDSNSSHPLNDSMENKSIILEKPINGDPILNSACNTYSDDDLDEDISLNENVNFTKLSNSKQYNSDQQVNNHEQQPKSPFSDEKLNGNLGCDESEPDDEFMDEDCDMDDEDDDDDDEEDDDDDDFMDTDDSSSFSSMSGFTTFFGEGWKAMNWIQTQMTSGVNPRDILSQILNKDISPDLDDMNLWKILASMLTEPPRRQKLPDINTIDDVVNLLKSSEKIIVLTGAGVSVSCGIPDFRSADGIYARLAKDYPDLPDPQAMFDIQYFSNDPRPFFKFAREIYPGQFTPSLCHRFIKLLENKGKLLRNYTQNIDTLEQVAGISNVIECHGSFATASCTKCKFKQSADDIRGQIFDQKIPVCPKCQPNIDSSILMVENFQQTKTEQQQEGEEKNDNSSTKEETSNQNECDKIEKSECSQDEKLGEEKDAINGNTDEKNKPKINNKYKELVQNGIMKPDIVFFGEGLPESFHTAIADDKDECDLLIVIGSSLKVRPVALIPNLVPPHIPQVLINLEQLPHMDFDVELLGDSDTTITKLCHMLGQEWLEICPNSEKHQENLQNGSSSNINQTDLCSEKLSTDSHTENVLDSNSKLTENHEDNSIKLNDHQPYNFI